MARKSRTQPKQSPDTLNVLSKVYKTAIYVRLSAEKDETRDRKTLINQRNLIKNFVDQQMDMEIHDIYMDDEISGTTFDRPEFERMMSDMRAGRINCIVVKDLSRLGRDYIETGNLVERVFPMMNIRFVAITDNYDSSKKDADLMVAVTNIANDLYAKDISKKISSSKQEAMEKGIPAEKYGKVYMCTHRKRYGKDSCNCLPVKVDDIYAAVLAVIKEQIQVFIDREKILKEHHNDSSVIRQEQVYTEAVNKCVKEMDRLMELKSGLYADYTEDLLDEKEYLQLNREYSQRIEKLKIQADEYRQAASQYESAEKTVAQLKAEMLRFKGKRKLTQEMVDLFVAQVRIYENKNLEIVLNYEDELKKFAELNMEREAG